MDYRNKKISVAVLFIALVVLGCCLPPKTPETPGTPETNGTNGTQVTNATQVTPGPSATNVTPGTNVTSGTNRTIRAAGTVDDWQYIPGSESDSGPAMASGGAGGSGIFPSAAPMAMQQPVVSKESIGLAVGGAKGIENFRKNIENNYLPLPTDITYEGLFYEYFFETGSRSPARNFSAPRTAMPFQRTPSQAKMDTTFQSASIQASKRATSRGKN